MKNAIKLFALVALAVGFAGCTHKSLEYTQASVTPTFTAGVSTKANGSYWTQDQIGITVVAADNSTMPVDYVNVGYETTSTGLTATFTPINEEIEFEDATETVYFTAYAPYVAGSAITDQPGTNGMFTNNTQSQNTAAAQTALDYLYAGVATGSESSPVVTFTFDHVMSQLTVNFVAGEGVETSDIAAGTYTLDGIVHDGEFDVDYSSATCGTAYTTGATADDAWELDTDWLDTADASYDASYSAIIFPQAPETLALSAVVAGVTYSDVDLLSYLDNSEFEAGNSYVYTITVTTAGLTVSGCTINDWNDHNYDITVGGGSEAETEGDGTVESPYSVSDIYTLVDAGELPEEAVYVSGYVAEIGALNETDHELTYAIADAGVSTNSIKPMEDDETVTLLVNDGLGLGGVEITAADYLNLNDEVVVYGTLSSTDDGVEVVTGSVIYSLNGTVAENAGDDEDSIVYYNDFDNGTPSSSGSSLSTDVYKNETGTGASTVTYDGTSKVTVRSTTSSSGYEGASGDNNIFFGVVTDGDQYFKIQNITLPGEANYTLSFGGYESGNNFEHDYFKVYVSEDGDTWVKIEYTFASGDPKSSWDLATSTFTVPTTTAALYIYFESDEASVFRIDDVKLEVSETAGTSIDFSAGVTVPETGDDDGEDEGSDDVETTGAGTVDDPYTIADVLALFEAGATDSSVSVYVTGKVSEIGELVSSYGELTYYLSDDGTTDSQFEIYEGKGLNGESITSADYLSIGDELVVCGNLKAYNGTNEMNYGSTIYSINGVTSWPVDEDDPYTTNVTWDVSDSHAYSYTFTVDGEGNYTIIKLGASSSGTNGTTTCTIPEGSISFGCYVVGWTGTTGATFTISVGDVDNPDYTYSGTATADSEFSGGNSYYSFTSENISEDDYYKITFDSALTESKTVTITTTNSSVPRVGIFGAKYFTE